LSAPLALITGASGGLGAAIAQAAAKAGYQLALLDTNAEALAKVAATLPGARTFACDITDEAAVDVTLARIDTTPDLLVNNAGIVKFDYLLDMSVADFRRILDVDLTGAFILSRACGRRMRDRGQGGSIVSISSIGGMTPSLGTNAYAPAKAGIIALTQLMALEFGPLGIRVNCVAPGFIDSGMSAPVYANPRTRELRANAVPLRSLGVAEDIAEAVMYLASDAAKYVHGHNLVVDGGITHSVLAQVPRA
jgi:NAD(P)-dependent dehydrogenase (short-subunit alcohol dehydrogenase family)